MTSTRTRLEELLTARRLESLIALQRGAAIDARYAAMRFLRAALESDAAADAMQESLDRLEDVTGLERATGADIELGPGRDIGAGGWLGDSPPCVGAEARELASPRYGRLGFHDVEL